MHSVCYNHIFNDCFDKFSSSHSGQKSSMFINSHNFDIYIYIHIDTMNSIQFNSSTNSSTNSIHPPIQFIHQFNHHVLNISCRNQKDRDGWMKLLANKVHIQGMTVLLADKFTQPSLHK